jgi:hypothetical protein
MLASFSRKVRQNGLSVLILNYGARRVLAREACIYLDVKKQICNAKMGGYI